MASSSFSLLGIDFWILSIPNLNNWGRRVKEAGAESEIAGNIQMMPSEFATD